MLNLDVLEAKPVGSNVPPVIDGYANDFSWRTTKALLSPIAGGSADAKEVAIKAAYDAEYLYLLTRWVDDKESNVRVPWVKQSDGSWKKAAAKPTPTAGTDWAAYMSGGFDEEAPSVIYEDKFSFIWNTYGPSNPATNGRPTFRGPSMVAPPFYIEDAAKVPLTDAELAALPAGSMIANMFTSGPTGPRADVDAKGIYDPATKTWTLEIRRQLVTGDPSDVQFGDLDRAYSFGVAVFDNAQIEHSWTAAVYKLKFKK